MKTKASSSHNYVARRGVRSNLQYFVRREGRQYIRRTNPTVPSNETVSSNSRKNIMCANLHWNKRRSMCQSDSDSKKEWHNFYKLPVFLMATKKKVIRLPSVVRFDV